MIGLYALNNATTPTESPQEIASYFSSISETIATSLPLSSLPAPTYTTPPYAFNLSYTASPGLIVSSGLGASTYSALLGFATPNVTAIPTVTPRQTLFTFFVTEGTAVSISVSTALPPSVTLGEPPGWSSSAKGLHASLHILLLSISALIFCLLV